MWRQHKSFKFPHSYVSEARDFSLLQNVQSCSEAHPASYLVRTRSHFLRAWSWPLSASCQSSEWDELYTYPHHGVHSNRFTFSIYYLHICNLLVTSCCPYKRGQHLNCPSLFYEKLNVTHHTRATAVPPCRVYVYGINVSCLITARKMLHATATQCMFALMLRHKRGRLLVGGRQLTVAAFLWSAKHKINDQTRWYLGYTRRSSRSQLNNINYRNLTLALFYG